MKIEIAGLVLRCKNRQNTAAFYSNLGLTVGAEHQHGGGPMHAQIKPTVEDFAVEIYAASDKHPTDALLLRVDSIEAVLAAADIESIMPIKEVGIKYRVAIISDPDGRKVILFQEIPAQ